MSLNIPLLPSSPTYLVELWLGGDMPANIESTRHIIQGHRTDTRDEDTLEHTLEFLEDITVEAIGMGDCPIYLFTLLIEHSIGKIVIFIDDQIERNARHTHAKKFFLEKSLKVSFFDPNIELYH